jgi:hypothetical protein
MCSGKLQMTFRSGKELNAWLEDDGEKLARVTIPKGRDELAPKTLASIIRQLRSGRELFDGLMACPNDRADLIARLRREDTSDAESDLQELDEVISVRIKEQSAAAFGLDPGATYTGVRRALNPHFIAIQGPLGTVVLSIHQVEII